MAGVIVVVAAFAITVAVTPLCAQIARRLDIVDRPGPLKVQTLPVPYLGGVAVLAGLVAPAIAAEPAALLPLGLAAALGVADDVTELSPRWRLAGELVIGVSVAAVVGGLGVLALLAVALTVALVNAVNFLDGLDGLASGVALVSAIGFAIVLDGDSALLAAGLAAALAGFLVWNRPPARIYLGDAGSYLVGATLALLATSSFGDGGSTHVAAASALLIAVPICDTTIAILRRWRAKRPLLSGDRGHVYDQLVDRGRTPGQATWLCIGAQAVLVGVAVVVASLGDTAAVLVTAATTVVGAGWAVATFTSPSSWTR